uniref:Selenium-binding protein n=2 Tax=Panagrolaimus sp. JU765 TaxID=591449 RepID=A0AC34QKV2_9BILA
MLKVEFIALSLIIIYISYYYGDFIYRSYLTLNRDLSGLALLLRVKFDLNRRLRENRGIHELFLDIVKANSDKTAIIDVHNGRSLTFKEFNELSNRFANYFKQNGFKRGDVIALFMENSIEFVAAWIGLAKIGVVTAWINSNLKMEPLAHCVLTSEAKAIITSTQLAPVLTATYEAKHFKNASFKQYCYGDVETNGLPFINLQKAMDSSPELSSEPPKDPKVDFRSILCFIYTSGTTGLPKAAVMKHFRYYSMVMGSARSFGIYSTDRIYISMPLYHTSAGIIGVGQMLLTGCSCVIRQRFSASNFWKDCVAFECTASQYIGEICRYLLAQPKCEAESQHKMRLMYGNGLRQEIWQDFVDRFRVRIGELYGSTEGTSNLVNIDGKVGACGFLPISPLTSKMHPVRLVKIDEGTGEVLRRKDGLCIPCRPGETGAMVSTIRKNNPLLIFEGYLNKNETSKKVICNVFRRGDRAFLTGDILHWDRLGYVYFKDRTGDTFRWKGENVSTTEVEAVLMPLKSVADVTVYGVQIQNHEGRAGMAAIVKSPHAAKNNEEFLSEISVKVSSCLASYAIPVFIRITNNVDKTGTFKLVKTHLQKASYNTDDPVYMWNGAKKRYYSFTKDQKLRLEAVMVCEKSNCGPGYASPADAIKGPKEKYMFVTCPCAKPEEGPDVLAVIDVDPESETFCKAVSTVIMPNKGDEVHHMGWNACSSCFGCANVKRSHLVLPCLNSSRIYLINVLDPVNPKIDRIVEKEELDKFDVSFPHTSHCLGSGEIMISTLGDSKGNNKGDFLLINSKTFEVVGTWLNREKKSTDKLPQFNYDFWYQPNQNLMISTEWGTPNKIKNGFDVNDVEKGFYGNKVHVYDWSKKEHKQAITLEGPEGWLPLEVRFKHQPNNSNAFVGTALGSGIYHFYKSSNGDSEMKSRLAATIPSKKVSNWALPEMPGLITDIIMSMDDNFLFISCWLHGDIRMYDIRDSFDIKLVGQCFLGGSIHKESGVKIMEDEELAEAPEARYVKGKKIEGGPQMLQLSLDGKRLYVTNSLYQRWDKIFYPKLLEGGLMLQLNVDIDLEHDSDNRLSLNPDFLVDFSNLLGNGIPYLAHEMRYPGGDCTSDIWL